MTLAAVYSHRTSGVTDVLLFVGPPSLVTGLLWMTSEHSISLLMGSLALLLAFVPWYSYLVWRRGPRDELPILAIICLTYWIYFAFPLFSGDWKTVRIFEPVSEISEAYMARAMVLVALGVMAMWSGATIGLGRRLTPQRLPVLAINASSLRYLRFLMVAGTLAAMSDRSAFVFGAGARQIVLVLITFVPMIVFAILFRLHLRGQSTPLDRVLIAGFLGLGALQGISSGWLGATAILVVICAAVYISEGRRIPRLAIIGMVAYVLFFQPGKMAFRERYWAQGDDSSTVSSASGAPSGKLERVEAWFDLSFEAWSNALADPAGNGVKDLLKMSQSRLSLLAHTANVVELTPDVVPFQYGRTYSYLVVALIPRVLWPDKPSMSEANRFYQVEYRVTREEDLEGVAIGIGILTEGYINFGWLGTITVMFLFGVVIDFIRQTFMSKSSGMLFWGIGVALIPLFVAPEIQMATIFGDLIQRLGFAVFLFLPFIRFQRPVRPGTALQVGPQADTLRRPQIAAGNTATGSRGEVEHVLPG